MNAILAHPGLTSYIRKDPSFLRSFHQATRRFSRNRKIEEARTIAERTLDLAICLGQPRGESHYHLARVYAALAASSDPEYVISAASELWWVFGAPSSVSQQLWQNSEFDLVRGQLDAELSRTHVIGIVGGSSVLKCLERPRLGSAAIQDRPGSSAIIPPRAH